MSRSRSRGPGRAHSRSSSAVTSSSCHRTFSKVTSPCTSVSDSNGMMAGASRITMSRASTRRSGIDVLERARPSEGRDDRSRGVGGADLEELRDVLDRRQVGGRRRAVQGGEPLGEAVHRLLALRHGERRPHMGERAAGPALLHEPVLAVLAAVGDDRRVADLGREDLGDQRLAVEAVVGAPVHPHGVGGGEPHLVRDAAGPLELDAWGRDPRRAAPCARANLCEAARRPDLSPWS